LRVRLHRIAPAGLDGGMSEKARCRIEMLKTEHYSFL